MHISGSTLQIIGGTQCISHDGEKLQARGKNEGAAWWREQQSCARTQVSQFAATPRSEAAAPLLISHFLHASSVTSLYRAPDQGISEYAALGHSVFSTTQGTTAGCELIQCISPAKKKCLEQKKEKGFSSASKGMREKERSCSLTVSQRIHRDLWNPWTGKASLSH